MRKKTSLITWSVTGALLLLLAFVAWQLLLPHTFESASPLGRSEALRYSPIDLPPSATAVRVATHRHWIQHVDYVRFEAPPADCETFAKALLPGAIVTAIHSPDASAVSPFNPSGVFRDLSWFDIGSISRGMMIGEDGPSRPRVYVDQDRGIFYYLETD